jgi:hypothetical protein
MSGFKPLLMKQLLLCIACSLFLSTVFAQKDPEFPKGWVMYLESHHGIATNFQQSPDLFVGFLSITPQVTIVPSHLRLGGTAGLLFTNKRFDGLFGPNLVAKITTLNVKQMGSILNLQLKAEHLWGTNKQKLIGGGIYAELGQLLLIGLSMHRDYGLNYWWFQGGLGYNLLHKKKGPPVDPLN